MGWLQYTEMKVKGYRKGTIDIANTTLDKRVIQKMFFFQFLKKKIEVKQIGIC